ncbi:50S ribosomal protein L11 methyltransferase [Bauldia sp.]|uniref:50S ribosomal protein L11 methyltransferase n=1 Tax=Bauldia sp. TaxID=2575872 RepID=UPI003BAD2CB3
MTWTATLTVSEPAARALADAIEDDPVLAGTAVDGVETGLNRWRVTLYFEHKPDAAERNALASLAAQAAGDGKPTIRISSLDDADWVAKSLEGLRPIRVGRFVVHGAHDRDAIRINDIGIEIEAGQAFGTGHHGTTAGCLAAIDQLAKRQRIGNALDVGTGSGVLAIAMAKTLRVPVLASDIDSTAVQVAAANARLNAVAPLVLTVQAAGADRAAFATPHGFDLIVANILAGPLITLAPSLRRRLAPGATLILSGILVRQANRVAAAYRAMGLRFVRADTIEGWTTLTFRRGP